MKLSDTLRGLRLLTINYVQAPADAADLAAKIGAVVASLNGILPDDGRAIAHAVSDLLFARCAGLQGIYLKALTDEIGGELWAMGEKL